MSVRRGDVCTYVKLIDQTYYICYCFEFQVGSNESDLVMQMLLFSLFDRN